MRGLGPEGPARRPALGEGAPGRLPPEGLFPPELHTVPPLALCGRAMTQKNKEGWDREKFKQKLQDGLTDEPSGQATKQPSNLPWEIVP